MTRLTLRGSSPLTRGKLRGDEIRAAGQRLIPAHAGKTSIRRRRRAESAGSSPLTRGKRVCALVQSGHDGLIPAHAGKTGPLL